MNTKMIAAALAVLAVGALVLTGCAGTTETAQKDPKVWGYVASADSAQIDLADKQDGVDELVVDRVLAPGGAWVVVHADDNGKPGMRVGLAHVDKGENTNVKVKLKDLTTPKVIVAVHADKGEADKFDFDMMNKEMSPDRPYFVSGKELAKVVTVREFGIPAQKGTAAIEVADQPGAKGSLQVDRAVAPAGAWIVVHLDDDGAPGARVGLLHIPSGENTDVSVPLEPLPLTEKLFVAVHADAGTPDVFDFDMMNKINSADQPYFVDGEEVATAVSVK
jgi:hypothetical protein